MELVNTFKKRAVGKSKSIFLFHERIKVADRAHNLSESEPFCCAAEDC